MSQGGLKSVFFFVFLVTLGNQSPVLGMTPVVDALSTVRQCGRNVAAWYGDYEAIIELVTCLAQVPGICATDSENALAIDATASLSMAITSAKIFKELFREQRGCLAKQCVYNIPKTLAYCLANLYDYMRLTSDPKEFVKGSHEAKSLRLFKITQFFQLGVELLFRIFALIDVHNPVVAGRYPLAGHLAEAADWVEVWRLLSRFGYLADQDKTFDARLEVIKQKIAEVLSGLSGEMVTKKVRAIL